MEVQVCTTAINNSLLKFHAVRIMYIVSSLASSLETNIWVM